jgi:hypothetical protein
MYYLRTEVYINSKLIRGLYVIEIYTKKSLTEMLF